MFFSYLKSLFYDCCTQNADVVDGPVVVVGEGFLHAFHHVHALFHLAEDGVLAVEVGRAALLAVKSVSEKPVFVTFTCNESGRTLTGSDPAAVLQKAIRVCLECIGIG